MATIYSLPDLPLLQIFSYLNIEKGENLNASLVCRLFHEYTKPYVKKYRIYQHYLNTFISYKKAKEAIEKYPYIRVCIDDYLEEDSKSLAPNLYKHHQTDGSFCITHETYDEKGKYHSYDDKPSYMCDDECIEMRWHNHGLLHREGDKPAVVFYDRNSYDFLSYVKWYCNGLLHREKGPSIIYENGTTRWYTNGELIKEEIIAANVAVQIIDDFTRDLK